MKKLLLLLLCGAAGMTSMAVSARAAAAATDWDIPAAPMRRPISPSQPMWLIHIDTWNWPDPQKIIDLVPDDIRPYAVMNISLSISHNSETGEMNIAPDGYEIARSWLRTCAENRVWATVQCASGGFSHFSEYDLSVYEEFYRDYPNFIGWNFAEQFWGFDDKFSCSWLERMNLFAELVKMAHRYGGYVISSWTGAFWGADINPIAMTKRSAPLAEALARWPEHFILCEKFTMTSCFHEIESTCLGPWLAGAVGHYGIRFDQCGWNESFGTDFPPAAGAIPVLSHMMLTGETVTDGPELIWQQDFRELGMTTTADGYTARRWGRFPQFDNISIDLFRKILDGSVRILSRQEVIDRTKLIILQDVAKGTREDYMTPAGLFDGLYKMDDDGEWLDNITWMKKTGRYPAVPTAHQLMDSLAETFEVKVNVSDYAKRWPTVEAKVTEFDALFPEEYTGDAYFSRVENAWVGYNPYIPDQPARAAVPFRYNTCERMEVVFSQYSLMQLRETADQLDFYLTNYRPDVTTLRADTIRIVGATAAPSYTVTDRADHVASHVTAEWRDGVYTLVVRHNGPLDLTVRCAGAATDRLTEVTPSRIVAPARPSAYTGPRQYEAESFDYRNIVRCVSNGFGTGVSGYTGQGYLSFGTATGAAARDTVTVDRTGTYLLRLRYAAPDAAVRTVTMYLNGGRVTTMNLSKSSSTEFWREYTRKLKLNAGRNEIRFQANSAGTGNFYIDNIVIEAVGNAQMYDFEGDKASAEASNPPAELISPIRGAAGVVDYVNAAGGTSHALTAYVNDASGDGAATLDMFPTDIRDYGVTWKTFFDASGAAVGTKMRVTASGGDAADTDGILFGARRDAEGASQLYIVDCHGDATTTLAEGVSSVVAATGAPVWLRAMAIGDTLTFDSSSDSLTWDATLRTVADASRRVAGATEWVWGHDGSPTGWVADDIRLLRPTVAVSRTYLDGFVAECGHSDGTPLSFFVEATDLVGDLHLSARDDYELSLAADGEYTTALTLPTTLGATGRQEVFVRLRDGLPLGNYEGVVTIATDRLPARTVTLTGRVVPPSVTLVYDFESDAAALSYTTIPAADITTGRDNGGKAGVVNYTDATGATGHWLKAYAGGLRNGTGVLNLNRFTDAATDYSITWRQCNTSATDSHKVGMLLRGDKSRLGTATTGYVQGIMQGYVFIVYNNPGAMNSEFRIYQSTASTSLAMLSNATVGDWCPAAGVPVYYRATARGETTVTLTFEYSADGKTWQTATTYTDPHGTFQRGSSQVVWGLAATAYGFLLDDIAFDGVTYDESTYSGITTVVPDDADGIESWYDLTGRRLPAAPTGTPGFYLHRTRRPDGTIVTHKIQTSAR